MSNILKRVIGGADNRIDDDIDRILYRFQTDTPEQFYERWASLSAQAKQVTKAALSEQIKVEVKHNRLDALEKLRDYLDGLD